MEAYDVIRSGSRVFETAFKLRASTSYGTKQHPAKGFWERGERVKKREKFCVVCGKRIPESSLRKTTCSEFCRSRYKCGYTPYKNCKKPPFDDLTTLQQKAHKEGMSYGKYMAMKYRKDEQN